MGACRTYTNVLESGYTPPRATTATAARNGVILSVACTDVINFGSHCYLDPGEAKRHKSPQWLQTYASTINNKEVILYKRNQPQTVGRDSAESRHSTDESNLEFQRKRMHPKLTKNDHGTIPARQFTGKLLTSDNACLQNNRAVYVLSEPINSTVETNRHSNRKLLIPRDPSVIELLSLIAVLVDCEPCQVSRASTPMRRSWAGRQPCS